MDAYIFAADIYCEKCGEAIRAGLIAKGLAPANPADETTYDSGVFPKGPFDDGGGEADTPQHCGSGYKCLDPTTIDGDKCGKFLENDLTQTGVAYVKEHMVTDPYSKVVQFWVAFYRSAGYTEF
jgi:hypothetical protein